jgi:hypothetical protein
MTPPPTKKENAKPSFHFDFNSPDLRARSNKMESIYSDSSDDETPKRARPVFPSNPTTFAAFLKSNEGTLLGQIAGGSEAPAVKKEEAANVGNLSRDVSLSNNGFGGFSKPTQEDSNSTAALNERFPIFAPVIAEPSFFKAACTQAPPYPGFKSANPPGSQYLGPFGAATLPSSTQGSSVLSSNLFPAAAMPSWLLPAATTTSAQVAPVSTFQNGARQVSQSLSPVGPVAQSSSASVPATSGTPSFLPATTTATAQVASVSIPKNNSSQVSQSPNLFGAVTQSAGTPKLAATIPESNMAQTEEARLFAAHIKLLDVGTSFQDQHEITGTPLFTKKVLDHSENLFNQYGFLAGVSEVLESNASAKLSIDGRGQPADPRLFFNISAPSSAFICGSQGSGKSHTLSCLLENCLMKSDVSKLDSPLAGLVFNYDSFTSDFKGTPCETAHVSSNPNVKVRVLVSPTNLETMKVSPSSKFFTFITDRNSVRTQV